MKLPPTKSRKCSGILLIQCLVYLAVFAILLTGAMTVLYFCWNHSEALIGATEQIHSALYTGERWRDDVRGATGKISMETTATGETVTIPEGKGDVRYYFGSGQVSRQSGDVKGNRAFKSQNIRNEDRCARQCDGVAMGTGIDAAPVGIAPAAAVHL